MNYNKIRGFEYISGEQAVIDQVHLVDVKLPIRGTSKSAGYDIFSPIDFELNPGDDIKVPTGIKVYMKNDEYLGVHPRSGQGFKFYLRLANTEGIIDSDYYNNSGNEGHIWVKIRNEGDKILSVKKGEAFAQAIFKKYLLIDSDEFAGNERVGGFGSTNK